jgi:8-oxo-dGTP diphosphatase
MASLQRAETAMTAVPDRPRASAAVLRHGGQDVLMVRHQRHDGTRYWQLPGGGLAPGESPEEAALRELREETGLVGTIVRLLFTIPYRLGTSTTFLVEIGDGAHAALGSDPEEAGADHRKLVDIAWLPLAEVDDNPEIVRLLHVLRYDPVE